MNCESCSNFDLDIYECKKNKVPSLNGEGILFCVKFIKSFNSGAVRSGFYPVGIRLEAKRRA